MKNYPFKFIFILIWVSCLVYQVYPQSRTSDESYHPFYVNHWITGGLTIISASANLIEAANFVHKPDITDIELSVLNKDRINSFDRWAVDQDPSRKSYYGNLSDNILIVMTVLPTALLFDKGVRHDWFDILFMYLETMSITNNVYVFSFLGPNYQTKFRPVVYYDEIKYEIRTGGGNRNSFYSGHTASTSAASFFMAKVYTDYHPEFGGYKYLIYAAAAIPPLILGYVRVKALTHFPSDVLVGLGVGALCGIVIPEFHRNRNQNISLGLYASPLSSGITMTWNPDFLK